MRPNHSLLVQVVEVLLSEFVAVAVGMNGGLVI